MSLRITIRPTEVVKKNLEAFAPWAKALRETELSQTRGSLCDASGLCCLAIYEHEIGGVPISDLLALAECDAGVPSEFPDTDRDEEGDAQGPQPTRLMLSDETEVIPNELKLGSFWIYSSEIEVNAQQFNDDLDLSFADIATILEGKAVTVKLKAEERREIV